MKAHKITAKYRDWVINTIVFLLMVLFIYASFLKLSDFLTFRAQLSKSPMITDYANILAWLVPGSEMLATIILFVPKTRLLGFYLSFSIMSAFTIYIALMIIFSPWLPCSCGGIIDRLGWTGHLIFNAVITLLIVIAIILIPTQEEYQTSTKPSAL